MATGILAVLDDVAILMNDVATMSKVAAKKTAGILGDDLAVNAEKASGFASTRELPVLWAITKGSFINKLIILPVIFLLSYYMPSLIAPILIIGGLYLAYEGFEKIYEYTPFHKHKDGDGDELDLSNVDAENYEEEIMKHEKKKIKSAIITDFILSLEIVIIALSAVLDKPFITQVLVTSVIAIIATFGVYGLVALLVRLDDFGFLLQKNEEEGSKKYKFGQFLVDLLPKIIKTLGVVGTVAMLLVAGGIFIHNISFVHHLLENVNLWILNDFLVGIVFGFFSFLIIEGVLKIKEMVTTKKEEIN